MRNRQTFSQSGQVNYERLASLLKRVSTRMSIIRTFEQIFLTPQTRHSLKIRITIINEEETTLCNNGDLERRYEYVGNEVRERKGKKKKSVNVNVKFYVGLYAN